MDKIDVDGLFRFSDSLHKLSLCRGGFAYCDYGNCLNIVIFSTMFTLCKKCKNNE